jgi:hypothetical protein
VGLVCGIGVEQRRGDRLLVKELIRIVLDGLVDRKQ